MNESMIKIMDEKGNYQEYKILFTFRCEELDNDYIAFTDGTIDKLGNNIIYIAYYNPESEINELIPVTDEDELEMAYEVLAEIQKAEI